VRADGEIIVLDAGSGIRLLGFALDKEFGSRSMKLTLLITHTHWDHIQGLPFFSPAYNQKNLIRVLGYEGARAGLATILASQMETPFFPVSLRELPSRLAIEELREMEFQIGKVQVRSKFANHPGICVGYRLFTSSGSIAFFPDNEPYEQLKLQLASRDGISEHEARDFAAAERAKMVDFLQDCDVAILIPNIRTTSTRSTSAGAIVRSAAWFRWRLMLMCTSSCFSITTRVMMIRCRQNGRMRSRTCAKERKVFGSRTGSRRR
jgi:Metal-dependent hydrolases of the beta-lactamase superfamily I